MTRTLPYLKSLLSIGTLACVVATLAIAPGLAIPSPGKTGTDGHGDADLLSLSTQLNDRAHDPLEPFDLSLGATVSDVERVASVFSVGYLGAGDQLYLQMSLGNDPELGKMVLPTPKGIDVDSGDLYFVDAGRLVLGSFSLRANGGPQAGLAAMERSLGRADFALTLPGAMDLFVGWRTDAGLVLATFAEGPQFQVSAFARDSEDLLVGPQMVLFDELALYAERVAAGESPQALIEDLLDVVSWIELAHSMLQPTE